jgi:hemerythrin-like metal-binding protein
VELSAKVAHALNDIVTKARQVDELAAEVASASGEQTQGITQINLAVGQMDKVTQSNAASAEESAAAAQELNAQAESMKESVAELIKLVEGRVRADSAQPSPSTNDRRSGARSFVREASSPARTRRARGAQSPGWAADIEPSTARQNSLAMPRGPGTRLIEWDEPLMSTGVDSIDSQHQKLIQHINELHTALQTGTAKDELLKMLGFLGEYVQSHFKHEEGVMQQHQCPVRGKNKAAHIQFLRDYEKLVETVKRDGATTTAVIQLQDMLGNWLKNHICSIDTNLRGCVHAHVG